MAFCPNCGTQFEVQPQRCQCGYLFGAPSAFATPEAQPGRFEFTGEGAALLILYVKLVLLSIVTLGIYSFWGRTAIRRYIWSNLRFAGQPFDYHGTGKELFLGWLKLIGLLLALSLAGALISLTSTEDLVPVLAVIYVLGLLLLVPLAIHGALRFRWSRTSWQGRRFSYKGDFVQLTTILIPGILLSAVTLTLYLPYFLTNMRRYITENTWYGGQQLLFDGDGKDVFWPYVKMLLLFIPTFGLYRFWFKANVSNYAWQKTHFANIPFRSTLQPIELLLLALTNALLTFFTLGIGAAWATCRSMRYWTENLQLEQLPRVQLLAQSADGDGAFGETLGDALGTDVGIDAGFGL